MKFKVGDRIRFNNKMIGTHKNYAGTTGEIIDIDRDLYWVVCDLDNKLQGYFDFRFDKIGGQMEFDFMKYER